MYIRKTQSYLIVLILLLFEISRISRISELFYLLHAWAKFLLRTIKDTKVNKEMKVRIKDDK